MNEKYIGDALLQKTYTTDFLTKKRVKNTGTVPQYYVEGDHEAIIPKDIFLLVQEELVRRRLVHTSENGKRHCYSCKHCFAQIVFCGECGEFYRRIHWNNRGVKSIVWRCCSRLENTGHACHSRTVNETVLEQVVIDAIADEILRLRDQRRQTEVDSVIKDEQMKQINDLQDFIKTQPTTVTEFDEALVGRLILKITVYHSYFTVEFKSGVEVNIEG